MENTFVNYAHRGASAYAPENTLAAFYLGLMQGADGIETDVQLTSEGIPVLFHDRTLERVTGAQGCASEHTLSELKQLWVRTPACPMADRIPTLEDFLQHFADQPVIFAFELKQSGVHRAAIELLDRFPLRGKVVLTSFDFEELAAARAVAPWYPIGWLADDFDKTALRQFQDLGGEQLCPHAAAVTAQKVAAWHQAGYNVRAWGVADEALMRHALQCGVDGMTVNFPDRLKEELCKHDLP